LWRKKQLHFSKYCSARVRGQRHDHVAAVIVEEWLIEPGHQLNFQIVGVSAEPLSINVHIVCGHVVGLAAATLADPHNTDFAQQIWWL
jgi:hypothetical protein